MALLPAEPRTHDTFRADLSTLRRDSHRLMPSLCQSIWIGAALPSLLQRNPTQQVLPRPRRLPPIEDRLHGVRRE